MAVMNRRNAILGWIVWQLAKSFAKRKAEEATPGRGEYAGLNRPAIAVIAATVAFVLLFWRKQATQSEEAA